MLGKLQPRFHLMGEAVWDAHRLESSADPNTVRVSEDVQALLADFLPSLIHVQRGKAGPEGLERARSSGISDGALGEAQSDATSGLHRRKKRSSKAKEGRTHKDSTKGSRGSLGGESKDSKESKESRENVKGSKGSLLGKSATSVESRGSQAEG
jgi:hypothetical protein